MSARTVRALASPAVAAGFGLAGVPADPIRPGGDPAELVGSALGRPDLAVVLIEESIYDGLGPELRRRLDRSAVPVVVPFPSPAGQSRRSAEDRVVELLRRAIGYRVRLR